MARSRRGLRSSPPTGRGPSSRSSPVGASSRIRTHVSDLGDRATREPEGGLPRAANSGRAAGVRRAPQHVAARSSLRHTDRDRVVQRRAVAVALARADRVILQSARRRVVATAASQSTSPGRRPSTRDPRARQPGAVAHLRRFRVGGVLRRLRDHVLLDDEPARVARRARARRRSVQVDVARSRARRTRRGARPPACRRASAITLASTSSRTSLTCTWSIRSPQSRSAVVGSPPPSARWPVSSSRPTSVSSSTRSISHGASTNVAVWWWNVGSKPRLRASSAGARDTLGEARRQPGVVEADRAVYRGAAGNRAPLRPSRRRRGPALRLLPRRRRRGRAFAHGRRGPRPVLRLAEADRDVAADEREPVRRSRRLRSVVALAEVAGRAELGPLVARARRSRDSTLSASGTSGSTPTVISNAP